MGKPYGKVKRKTAAPRKKRQPGDTALRIKLRGKDGAPLSMQEIRDGLFEAARKLAPYEHTHRVARATLYLTLVDEGGKPVLPDGKDEWEIHAYKCAANAYEP